MPCPDPSTPDLTLIADKYDYIWYIDSDATVNPHRFNRSVLSAINEWAAGSTVVRGQPDPLQATFLFFNNHPWRDNMPCAGSFIFRPNALAERVLRQWWDYDLPVKNFLHFHEQDALWHMIEDNSFFLNSSHYSVVAERQFPSSFKRYEDLWLVHIASYNFALRIPVLWQFLRNLRRNTIDTFQDAIDMLYSYHIYKLDPLQVAEDMEAVNLQQAAQGKEIRRTSFPPHDVKKQSAWYDEHVTSRNQPTLPLGALYEGRLVRFKGEYFFVQGGLKRPFANYEAFLSLRLTDDYTFPLTRHESNNMPTGEVITKDMSAEDKLQLMRYYQPLPAANASQYYDVVNEFSYKNHKLSARECLMDSELANLMLAQGNSSARMFIIGHSNDAINIAKGYAHCKEHYMKILPIPSTVFFESIVYENLLLDQLRTVAPPVSYFIIGTYKTVGKSLAYNSYTQSLTNVRVLLRHAALRPDYDIIPFLRSGSAFLPFALYFHGPPFQASWDKLLLAMGYDLPVIRGFDQSKQIFFRNIFIIKTSRLEALCAFMSKAMDVAKNNAEVAQLLSKDSKYKEGDVKVAMKIFGTDYYQLHPFLFERLPAFFAYASGWKVCQESSGPCKYNS